MALRSPARSRSGSRDGLALIIVLAFILLTSILIISFIAFSQSNRSSTVSYAKAIQAQEIAQGGIQDILSDFHQEIIAGSTVQNAGNTAFPSIFVPSTNLTAQPARIGYASSSYTNDVSSTLLPPTLLRVSRAAQSGVSTDFYPPMTGAYYTGGSVPFNRASAANSATASANGRTITAARWNQIALLSTNSTIPAAFATNTPDWVYVTRGGSRACGTNDLSAMRFSTNLTSTNVVTGRYAFAVYDEGALLDINAAGYVSAVGSSSNWVFSTAFGAANNVVGTPTNSYAGITETLSSKSSEAYADLTQLPGLAGKQTVIDTFIKWRNASVSMPGSTTGATNFLQSAFTWFKNGTTPFSTGDSPVVGRQDLIRYFESIDPTGTTYSQALPYLGTFERAVNQPSWHPTDDAANLPGAYSTAGFTGTIPDPSNPSGATITYINPSLYAYKSNAEQSTLTSGYSAAFHNPNPDIANVRFATAASITRYSDSGASGTYPVQPGDPLVQHRFSLAKLSWITYNGVPPSGISAAAIQACFGLVWDSAGYRWDYVGPSGSTLKGRIETLSEVGNSSAESDTTPREPNFFELLKAGILSGSLGQCPGNMGSTSNPTKEGVETYLATKYNSDKDRHIMQIGANIIDQADSDSYPTVLYLQIYAPSDILPADDLCVNTVYGDENLPNISRITDTCVGDPFDSVANRSYLKFWIHPELWNIHQAPHTQDGSYSANFTTGKPGYPFPSNFRLHAYGKMNFVYGSGGAFGTPIPVGAVDYEDSVSTMSYHGPGTTALSNITGQSPSSSTPGAGLLYFTDGKAGAPSDPFYITPLRLATTISFITIPNSSSTNATVNLWNQAHYYGMPSDYSGNNSSGSWVGSDFAAFFGGEIEMPDLTTKNGFLNFNIATTTQRPLYFAIEYQDPTGVYRPYGWMARIALGYELGQTCSVYNTNYGNTQSANAASAGITKIDNGAWCLVHLDPRTDRMGAIEAQTTTGGCNFILENNSLDHGPGGNGYLGRGENYFPQQTYGFVYTPDLANQQFSLWTVNQPSAQFQYNAFYVDPDGIIRPGDSYRRDTSGWSYVPSAGAGNIIQYSTSETGDGGTGYLGTATTAPVSGLSASNSTHPKGSAQARRPVILNRPFRNVGELGYAYRDLPYKSIDFFSAESADGALLDLFSVVDEPTPTMGQINPSNAPASVLTAIFAGANKMEINDASTTAGQSVNFMNSTEAKLVGGAVASYLTQNGGLNNRADLVTKLSDPIFNTLMTASSSTYANYRNKAYAEAPLRSLSNITNTRVWNLLIDIIAQSGQMSSTATTLNDFIVQGEKRYWLHVAIDRYTGKIVDQELEMINP